MSSSTTPEVPVQLEEIVADVHGNAYRHGLTADTTKPLFVHATGHSTSTLKDHLIASARQNNNNLRLPPFTAEAHPTEAGNIRYLWVGLILHPEKIPRQSSGPGNKPKDQKIIPGAFIPEVLQECSWSCPLKVVLQLPLAKHNQFFAVAYEIGKDKMRAYKVAMENVLFFALYRTSCDNATQVKGQWGSKLREIGGSIPPIPGQATSNPENTLLNQTNQAKTPPPAKSPKKSPAPKTPAKSPAGKQPLNSKDQLKPMGRRGLPDAKVNKQDAWILDALAHIAHGRLNPGDMSMFERLAEHAARSERQTFMDLNAAQFPYQIRALVTVNVVLSPEIALEGLNAIKKRQGWAQIGDKLSVDQLLKINEALTQQILVVKTFQINPFLATCAAIIADGATDYDRLVAVAYNAVKNMSIDTPVEPTVRSGQVDALAFKLLLDNIEAVLTAEERQHAEDALAFDHVPQEDLLHNWHNLATSCDRDHHIQTSESMRKHEFIYNNRTRVYFRAIRDAIDDYKRAAKRA